jgi:hypothetical protein
MATSASKLNARNRECYSNPSLPAMVEPTPVGWGCYSSAGEQRSVGPLRIGQPINLDPKGHSRQGAVVGRAGW